ncbi:hypothetical protein ACFQH6_08350 [Halobacteriaceae archaeon GCM10025711]
MERQASVKVPDGKLVSVRATVDDRFQDVQIRGDFFLEPPEALADLEAAVEETRRHAPGGPRRRVRRRRRPVHRVHGR